MSKVNIKDVLIKIGNFPPVKNAIRSFVYFLLLFVFISILYKENVIELLELFFFQMGESPNLGITIFFSSVLFLVFATAVSAIAATREKNHFKTSFGIRLILFVMNAVPIALFQHVLLVRFGFWIIYFSIIYLGAQLIFDLVKSRLPVSAKSIKTSTVFNKITSELLALIITTGVFLTGMLLFPSSINMRNLDMYNISHFLLLCLYIVLFNSITFFTVEYCISVFSDEYKKNYVKYYFVFNKNVFRRLLFTFKNAMPQVIEKIRKNISWLVMFIIAVNSIFETSSSLGSNLLSGYIDSDGAIILIRNLFHLLFVMYLINTCFDIVIEYFHRLDKKRDNKDEDQAVENKKDSLLDVIVKKTDVKKIIGYGSFVLVCIVAYILLLNFCQQEYAFAGYYDFAENQKRTFGDFLESKKIGEERCYPVLIEQYSNLTLCIRDENVSYYSLLQLEIKTKNGDLIKVVPFYDAIEQRYFFIQGNKNIQRRYDISFDDYIVSVARIEKYKTISFLGSKLVSFTLPIRSIKNPGVKPLFLIVPFYLSYFLTLLLIVALIVCSVYFSISRYFFVLKNKSKSICRVLAMPFRELLSFLGTINVVVVFLLVNLLFRRLQSDGGMIWENQSFMRNLLSYCLVQIIVAFMFSDSYINEIILYVKKMRLTREFNYYKIIGMSDIRQYHVYNNKYGNIFLLKLIFQNIIFVLNINWFIAYAFNTWQKFTDYIGVTYAISFENIFTKIIRFELADIGIYNYLILIGINIILFGLYYFCQRKLTNE